MRHGILTNCPDPVGILPEIVVIIRIIRVIIEFLVPHRVKRSSIGLIVEHVHHQGGVLVPVQHWDRVRLHSKGCLKRVIDHRLPAFSTLGPDVQHTIGGFVTPNGRGGSIFQHGNLLDIFRGHTNQSSILLFISIGKVKVRVNVGFKRHPIHHNQGLVVPGKGSGTTNTNLHAHPGVTRGSHNVHPGDTALKSLINRSRLNSFQLRCINTGIGTGDFTRIEVKNPRVELPFSTNLHNIKHLGFFDHLDVNHRTIVDGNRLRVITHIVKLQTAGRVDHNGVHPVHIGHLVAQRTAILVNLLHVHHHQGLSVGARGNSTRDPDFVLSQRGQTSCHDCETQQTYNVFK